MVYVVNDGRKIITCRSGDNYFLSTCLDMSLCFSLAGVETGALEYYINTEFAPRQLSCVRLSIDRDLLAVNCDRTRSNNRLTVLSENSVFVSNSVLALFGLVKSLIATTS